MKRPSSSLTYSDGAAGPVLALVDRAGLEWRDFAVCAEVDGDLWFPGKGESSWPAKIICASCDLSVRTECLAYALEHDEWGVWGGTTELERRNLGRSPSRAAIYAVARQAGTRKCTVCGQRKPVPGDFPSDGQGGYLARCRDCFNAAERSRRAARRDGLEKAA